MIRLEYPPGATPIDPDEARDLIPSYVSNQGELNEAEQANILDARLWAMGRKHKALLSEPFVKKVHKKMFENVWKWAGTYRHTGKNIGAYWPQISTKVRELCESTQYWIDNQTYPWDELAVRFHHAMVLIHPFPNGNGRHARLMTDMLLEQFHRPAFTWGSATSPSPITTEGQTRTQYIQALQQADQHNFAPLIAFAKS